MNYELYIPASYTRLAIATMCLATVLKATNLTTFTNVKDCKSMSGAVWSYICASEWDREWVELRCHVKSRHGNSWGVAN